jgi:oligoribonuclease (3'-5' exoribonuclease)
MKYFVIDIETTGLIVDTDSILEIACIFEDTDKYDEPIESRPIFHVLCAKENLTFSSFGALQMHLDNGLISDICSRKLETIVDTPSSTVCNLISWIIKHDGSNKVTVAGKNIAGFDWPFIEAARSELHFKNKITDSYVHHRMIDVGSMYVSADDEVIPDLKECCFRAGIPYEGNHRARGDAIITAKCIREVMSNG